MPLLQENYQVQLWMLLKMNFNLTLMITKMLNDQKPSKEELLELQKSQDKISKFITDRTFGNKRCLYVGK